MTDNGDGTYSYSYTVNQSGEITVLILMQTSGVYGEFYDNYEMTGPVFSSNMSSIIYYTFDQIVVNGKTEYVSSIFTTSLLAPSSGEYYIQVDFDDGMQVQFENDIKYAGLNVLDGVSRNFNESMEAGQYYFFKVWQQNSYGPGNVSVSWIPPGGSFSLIPASAYFYRRHVGSTPYQVSVACPTGYSGTDPTSPYL